MRVSGAWRGYGSALFLELGALRPMQPPRQAKGQTGPHPSKGEATVMIEWSWRVERARSVEVGSWSSERRINAGIKRLTGSRISEITIDGRLPELVLALTGGRWVHSFMTADGQPEWTVFLRDGTWLTVEEGHLIQDAPRPQPNKPLRRTGYAGR